MASCISRQPGLSAAELKIIAVIAMTGDHLAWAFLPTVSLPAFFLHLLGRIAMPVMCFFIAEGYRHTHSVPRYALRLGFFALVSAVPFSYFDTGTLLGSPFSVLYTLLLGLLAIWACDSISSPLLCMLVLAALALLVLPGDWGVYGLGWCLLFFWLRGRRLPQALCFSALVLCFAAQVSLPLFLQGAPAAELICIGGIQLGGLLALPLLATYNGRPARRAADPAVSAQRAPVRRRAASLAFYFYYPLHLALIDLALWRLGG